MQAHEFIYTTLRDNAQVAALLNDKIYPQVAPQEVTAPYCTYNIVSELPSECRETHEPVRVQVSVFCQNYNQFQALKKAVKKALDNQRTPGIESDFINAVDLYENGDLLRHAALDFQLITQIKICQQLQ